MKVEPLYLILLVVSTGFGVYYYFQSSINISAVHTLLLLAGGVLTAVLFIVTSLTGTPTEIGSAKGSNLLMQAGIGNILLGIPYLRGAPIVITRLDPTEILVAIAAEEVFRIAAALWLAEGFGTGFALPMSGIVFALMHMFWNPGQWLFAIFGGAILSGLLFLFQSQVACVLTHYGYDLVAFGYVQPLVFLIASALTVAVGYALTRREK